MDSLNILSKLKQLQKQETWKSERIIHNSTSKHCHYVFFFEKNTIYHDIFRDERVFTDNNTKN